MHNQESLTTGNIRSQLWNIAWPMMLTMFFHTLYNLVDAYWVSRLSDDAVAAVSISQIALFIMISFGFGVTAGSGVVMSQYIGAKKMDDAGRVLGQSFVLSAIIGVCFSVIALVFREQLLTASGAAGDIFAPALDYFTVTSAGSILFFLMISVMFAFNAQGDTFSLTKLFALSTGMNLIIDPLLIFGWGAVPAFGIAGAAIATLISQGVFIVIAIRSLSRAERVVPFRWKNLSFEWESVKRVLNIGIPAALTQIIFPLGLAMLTFITTKGFAEAGAIALSLGFRVEFFAYLPAAGFGFAAMTMIGQNLGANKPERVQKSFHTALTFAAVGASGLGLLVALFADPATRVFSDDPLVLDYAKHYMWIVALSYGFLAALMVEANSFQALGKSWNGFWLFVLRSFVITAPLTYLFAVVLETSISIVWVAVTIGNIVPSIVGYFWIKGKLAKAIEASTESSSNEEPAHT